MIVEFTIDWYSGTLTSENGFYLSRVLMLGDEIVGMKAKGQFGYNACKQFESGARIMWHDQRPDMGTHIILSGSALRWITAQGQDVFKVMDACNRLGARCSRVDLAIDVRDSGIKQAHLCKPHRLPYKGKGRTPKFTQVGDQEDGWTLYVGSRSSDKFLRIYDKGRETGDENIDWVRIETECKGMVAHWLGSTLPSMDVQTVYVVASEMVRGMVDFAVDGWSQALSSERCELSIPKKTARDTLGWLIKTCAPALARIIAENPNSDVLEAFKDAVDEELGKYGLSTS